MTKMDKKAENVILAFWNSHQQERQYWHRDGVAAALREVIVQLGYFKYDADEIHGNTIVNVRDILVLCEELEGK